MADVVYLGLGVVDNPPNSVQAPNDVGQLINGLSNPRPDVNLLGRAFGQAPNAGDDVFTTGGVRPSAEVLFLPPRLNPQTPVDVTFFIAPPGAGRLTGPVINVNPPNSALYPSSRTPAPEDTSVVVYKTIDAAPLPVSVDPATFESWTNLVVPASNAATAAHGPLSGVQFSGIFFTVAAGSTEVAIKLAAPAVVNADMIGKTVFFPVDTPTVALHGAASYIRDINAGTNTIFLSFLNGPFTTLAASSDATHIHFDPASVAVTTDMVGKYVVFSKTTTTAALRGLSFQISAVNTGTNIVTVSTMPATPVDLDSAFISSTGGSSLSPLQAVPTDSDFVMLFDGATPAALNGQVDEIIVTGPLIGASGTTQNMLVIDGQSLPYSNLSGKLVRFDNNCATVSLRNFLSIIADATLASNQIILTLLTPLPAVPGNLDTFNVVAELIRETPVLEILLG